MVLTSILSLVDTSNSLALALILTSTVRVLLRYNCRALRGLSNLARTHVAHETKSSALAPSCKAFFGKVRGSFVSPELFEKILSDTESGIRKVYQGTEEGSAGSGEKSESERQEIERQLCIEGIVPDALLPVMQRLLTTVLDSSRSEVKIDDLFFKNYAFLGLGDDITGKRWRKSNPVDAVRKVILNHRVPTRTCTRCGSVMEDLIPSKGMTPWWVNMHRTCFCGSGWMVEGLEGQDGG